MFKLKYLIPIIGFWLYVLKDIPLTERERQYKPLQGDDAFPIMFASAIISQLLPVILLLIYLK